MPHCLSHAAQLSELGWKHTSGSPLLGAGSNCKNFLFMVSFTSMIAAMFPVHPCAMSRKDVSREVAGGDAAE